MSEIFEIKTSEQKIGFNFFLDDSKGVLVDISECMKNENLKLSEVQSLCENVTGLNKKDNNYYINNYLYISSEEYEKYVDDIWKQLDDDIMKGQNYLCIKHIGKYKNRYKSYYKLLDEIKNRNYKIIGIPVEQYVDGSWNKTLDRDYLTVIMIPICKN